MYAETVEFLRLCYSVERGDSRAYGAIDVFLQTVEHGKILGILGSIEVSQPVTWIITYLRNIARTLAFEFGESSKSALLRLIWLLIAAFPDHADLIFTSFSLSPICALAMHIYLLRMSRARKCLMPQKMTSRRLSFVSWLVALLSCCREI